MAGQKEEATNTFSEGLIMDLNPLSTPNNVLTDCINGTIITYNGNELILQNDMGNYKLKNAKLKTNFVPVGLKEYAGIIYIVSYNPVTKETEIGSYPSPQRIFASDDTDNEKTIEPLLNNNTPVRISYNDLSKNAELIMYAGTNLDDYLINPGDDFRLDIEIDSTYDFQTVDFFILDKDKILTEIEIHEEYIGNPEYKKVPWSISGWLCGKYRLLNFDKFSMYVSKMTYNEIVTDSIEIDLNLSFNLDISDKLLKIFKENNKSSIYIELQILSDNASIETRNIKLEKFIEYGKVSTTYYLNLNNFKITDADVDAKYKLKATPYIFYDSNTKKLIYDHLTTIVELDNLKIVNIDDITALDIYKYTSSYDNGTGGLNLNFDITASFENPNLYKLVHSIYNLKGELVGKMNTGKNYYELIDINWFGQNSIDIPFENGFSPEEMYVFELKIINADTEDIIKSWKKLMITSVLLNESFADYNNFEEIRGDIWLKRLDKLDTFEYDYESMSNKITESVPFTPPIFNSEAYIESSVAAVDASSTAACTINCECKYNVKVKNFKYIGMFSKGNRKTEKEIFNLIYDNDKKIPLDFTKGNANFDIKLTETLISSMQRGALLNNKLARLDFKATRTVEYYYNYREHGDIWNGVYQRINNNESTQKILRHNSGYVYLSTLLWNELNNNSNFINIMLKGYPFRDNKKTSWAYEKNAWTYDKPGPDKWFSSLVMMVGQKGTCSPCIIPYFDGIQYADNGGWYNENNMALLARLNTGMYTYTSNNNTINAISYSAVNTNISNITINKIEYMYDLSDITYTVNGIEYNLLSTNGLANLRKYISDTFELTNLNNLISTDLRINKVLDKSVNEIIDIRYFGEYANDFNSAISMVHSTYNDAIINYNNTNNQEKINKIYTTSPEKDMIDFCSHLRYDDYNKFIYAEYTEPLLGVYQAGLKDIEDRSHCCIYTLPISTSIKLPKYKA